MKPEVIGIGNALVDIQARVDDATLERVGYAKGLMTLSSPQEQAKLLEALEHLDLSTCSGGSAANTVHGVGSLGVGALYIGRVANDHYGRLYHDDMTASGVGFPGPGTEKQGTGTSVVLITPDAQRTMVTHLGVSTALHPDDVAPEIVRGARMVYVEGYLWTEEHARAAALELAEAAHREGARVAFTLSDGFVIEGFRDDLKAFVESAVDVLFCNDLEARTYVGTDDDEEAFARLQEACETVFVTHGKDGAWVGRRGAPKVSVKGLPVDAIDTTGAGDLFAAGALAGLVRGKDLRESAILGCYCAAQVVQKLGARLPADAERDLDRILRTYAE